MEKMRFLHLEHAAKMVVSVRDKNPALAGNGKTRDASMSDDHDDFDHGQVMKVALTIAGLVFVIGLAGFMSNI